jgi:site-specific DNA-methyltransferase (adenine-specific)
VTVDLRLGDCLDVLKTLPDASVDAVITDPPYAQTNEAYDSAIACNPQVWRECFRVARPNAALVSFAGSPTYHRIASAIEAGGWKVRQMWGWVYRDGMITSAWPREGFDRLAPAMDPICYATKGKVLLGLEREGDAAWHGGSRGLATYSGRSDTTGASKDGRGRWPRSVAASEGAEDFQYFVLSRGSSPDPKTGHPNQKPLDIMRWIVSKLPGGVALDPFAGSATTLIAARERGMDAIGIERDPEYFAIAECRIAEACAGLPLFAGASA